MRDHGEMSDGSRSLLDRDGLGHPHRCQAGHRWQHTGLTAVTCTIPAFDSAGDLPCVGPQDCPVCCGCDDVLVRGVHTHWCNMCDGDWDHEGRCLDGLPAWCPWCVPTEGSPTPGARTGPHFHCCPACGTSWRHTTACSAPLTAALPGCSGCFDRNKRRTASPAFRVDHVSRPRDLVRPLAVTVSLAASVLLSVPLVLKGWPAFWTAVSPIVEPPRAGTPLASTAPEQARMEETPVVLVPPSEPATRPPRAGVSARRAKGASPPSTSRPQEASPLPRATAPPPTAGGWTESLPAASPEPSPSMLASEPTVETPPETPDRLAAAPIETPARLTVTAEATKPSLPGAPPFGILGGGSGWETFLEGRDPRPIDRSTRRENQSRY
jgi:hypothetical protein